MSDELEDPDMSETRTPVDSAFDRAPYGVADGLSRLEEVDMATLNLRYYVSGELSCDPVSIPVEFVADLDLDSGKLNVSKR